MCEWLKGKYWEIQQCQRSRAWLTTASRFNAKVWYRFTLYSIMNYTVLNCLLGKKVCFCHGSDINTIRFAVWHIDWWCWPTHQHQHVDVPATSIQLSVQHVFISWVLSAHGSKYTHAPLRLSLENVIKVMRIRITFIAKSVFTHQNLLWSLAAKQQSNK